MSEDNLTLYELMFHAEQFCLRVEKRLADLAPHGEEDEELRLKLGHCRNLLSQLQEIYQGDDLRIENIATRTTFRYLIIALLWVAFRARRALDFRLYRMLVMIESGFTYLLVKTR